MLLYTVLSAIGAIFTGSFSAVFTNPNWFFLYSILCILNINTTCPLPTLYYLLIPFPISLILIKIFMFLVLSLKNLLMTVLPIVVFYIKCPLLILFSSTSFHILNSIYLLLDFIKSDSLFIYFIYFIFFDFNLFNNLDKLFPMQIYFLKIG